MVSDPAWGSGGASEPDRAALRRAAVRAALGRASWDAAEGAEADLDAAAGEICTIFDVGGTELNVADYLRVFEARRGGRPARRVVDLLPAAHELALAYKGRKGG